MEKTSEEILDNFTSFLVEHEPLSYFEKNKVYFIFDPMKFLNDYYEKLYDVKDVYYLTLLEELSHPKYMFYGILNNEGFVIHQQGALILFDTKASETIEMFNETMLQVCRKNNHLLQHDLQGH